MSGQLKQNPEYFEYQISDFQGNPLIEALRPLPDSDEDIIERLSMPPTFNEDEVALPSMLRCNLPQRLRHFMFPMKQHIQIYQSICAQIFDGYRHRNPCTADGQRLLHYGSGSDICSPINRTSTISFLTGISGIGKSTLVNNILKSFGDPVIKHNNYKEVPLNETQIVYLKVNAPDQCSPKSLCETLGALTDSLLDTEQYRKSFSYRANTTQHVLGLRKMLENNHVGLLVIDAFENISLARSGGKDELAALIGNLRDGLGCPLLLVGTYKAADLLDHNMSTARRFSEGGYYELEKPLSSDDEDWAAFCSIAWDYQWVRKPVVFDDDIRDVLFDFSQGITGIMLTLFINAQIEAIQSGSEVVDIKLLRRVYRSRLQPIHDMINALRSGHKESLVKYEDLYRESMASSKIESHPNRIHELQTQTPRRDEQNIARDGKNVATTPPKAIRRKKRSFEEIHQQVHS